MEKKTYDIPFIIFQIIIAALGAIIGMQIIVTLGITPNTSIVGALIAMVIAKIPVQLFARYRDIETQNLIQTNISSATFGAANSLLIPIALPFVMGRSDLIYPMLIGAGMALLIDVVVLYKVFDSKLFSAEESWPSGVASAEAIKAGDEGGSKAKYLGGGILAGVIGSQLGIPMSAFGVAFIGNIWALSMFGVGLLTQGYSEPLFNLSLDQYYIPHGVMIGAGLAALGQFIFTLMKGRKETNTEETARSASDRPYTRSDKEVSRAFGIGFVLYIVGALIMALVGGIVGDLGIGQLILFIVFAACAALITEVIVGVAAMHSGWFPAFAVTLISLIIGLLIGFPPVSLAFLVGYTAATGPAFADFGYDLKAGFVIRGKEKNRAIELKGRRMQLWSAFIGLGVAILMVLFFHDVFFSQNLFPPVAEVYATTIAEGITGQTGFYLLMWAIPGAIVQLIGGPKRQIGILFATGLLVGDPIAGWAVIVGIVIRIIVLKRYGESAQDKLYTVAAGCIAGDALNGFFTAVWDAF